MKHLAAAIVVLTMFNVGNAQTPDLQNPVEKGPIMTFDSVRVNLGNIPLNASGKFRLKYTNTGNEDLIVLNNVGTSDPC